MGLSAVLSGLGAVKSLFGGDPAEGYYNQAAQSLRQKNQLLQLMSQLAQQYDPHQATQDAVNYASQTAGKTLGNTLAGLDQQYQAGGGDPTGDTRFRVSAQGATDRALDPLKQFAADRSANELMSKLQAMQMAAGADTGQVANSYMQMAGANKQDMSGALGTLGSSLTSIFKSPTQPTPKAAVQPVSGQTQRPPDPYKIKYPGDLTYTPNNFLSPRLSYPAFNKG